MITFTPEQQDCVDYILEQVEAGEAGKNVVVSGQGGVGKTEMVCELVCILLTRGKRVAVAAMTGKATSILRGKIHKKITENGVSYEIANKNLLVDTVQKITKDSKVIGMTATGTTLFSNTWKDPTEFDFDVLIIDELSMVPHFVAQWWQRTKCRVIGLGDFCQLPEVTTAETKKELAGFLHDLHLPPTKLVTGYGVKVLKDLASKQLTKVLRSDNEVALLCNDLRDFTMSKAEIVGLMKTWAEKTENIIYSTSLAEVEKGFDWQIICFTNKMCQRINDDMCIGGEFPSEQDKILLCDNINPIQAFNGETYRFDDLIQKITRYNIFMQKKARPRLFVCFKFNNRMPRANSRYILERNSFENYQMFKQEAYRVSTQRLAELPEHLRMGGFAGPQIDEWVEHINELREEIGDPEQTFNAAIQYLQGEDMTAMKYVMERAKMMPRLYMCHIEYGYAITTHKSQGSEYEKVCYLLERFDKPLLYTGVSRAKKKVKIINLTSTK